MTLVERLEKCRKQLDDEVDRKLVAYDYDPAIADLRDLIADTRKQIEELMSCQKR